MSASGAAAEDPIGGPLLTGTGVVVDPAAGTPNPPKVDATSFVLADFETGEILAAKAPHQRLRPASTLKMLTALALLPRLDLDEEYTATFEDDAQVGSAVGIVEGLTYTIDQLFLGLFLASGNDAAHALARAAGGMDETVALMQEEAERVQALDTTPKNPSGLDVEGQLSSAYDLALIGRAGLQIDEFSDYAATKNARFPTREGTSTYAITNHNDLLGSYDGAIGIKNGYTKASQYTFIGAATRNGRTLIVSLMKGEERVQREAGRLMDWGFQYADAVEPVGVLVDPVPDEPAPPPGPTAAPAAAGGEGESGPFGLPVGQEEPIAAVLAGFALLAGGAGTAIIVRRARRRRALRAELVHWATMRPRRPSYGPPLRHHAAVPGPTGPPGPYRRPRPPNPPEQVRRGPAPAPHADRWAPPPPPHDMREHPPPQRRRPGPPRPPYEHHRRPPDNDGRGDLPGRYR